jgi:hypothetical protein
VIVSSGGYNGSQMAQEMRVVIIMFGYKGKVMMGHTVYCSSQFGGSQYFTFS